MKPGSAVRTGAVVGGPHLDDDRQVLVDREVAPAGARERERGLGDGQDGRPDLDGGLEAGGPSRGPHAERRRPLVQAVIVGHVRAAAEDDADGE